MKSGIYVRIGVSNKDLVTECSRVEFLDWVQKKFGIEATKEIKDLGSFLDNPFFRAGLLCGLEGRYGVPIYKVKDEWESFLKSA